MSYGAGLAGFVSGIAGGMQLGQMYKKADEEYQLAKVREQGIAEARAMQAAAAPKMQDLGDEQNLTANPQASRDPHAQPEPVNTSLAQFQNNVQAQQDGGPQTQPVAPPQMQDANRLSDQPLASAAPNAQVRDPEAAPAFANGLPQTPRKRFNVDGQGFDTADEAAAYVKKSTPDLSTFYDKTLVPRMRDKLLEMGRPDQAEAWEKYSETAQTKANAKTWLKALQLERLGDHMGSAEELFKLHPHYKDGYKVVSADAAKSPDGKQGYMMVIEGPDGEQQKIFQDAETITRLGLPALSPIEAFKKEQATLLQHDVMQAKEAIDLRNDTRTADRQMANTKQRDADAAEREKARLKAASEENDKKIKARLDQSREGWAAAATRDADKIASQGQYRKAVSPEERQAIVVSGLSKDPMFNMLSPEEKKQRVLDTMALIPQPKKAAQTVPNPGLDPRQQGIPSAAPAGKKAVTVWDPTTNGVKTVYRD
jgi:hypothetical protein